MPDNRLAELLNQRALLSRHVAWLDAEIARASGSVSQPETPVRVASVLVPAGSTPSSPMPLATSTPVTVNDTVTIEPEPVPEAVALANKRADEIMANYSDNDKFNPDSTRRGCIMLATAVFLIGASILIAIYLVKYR